MHFLNRISQQSVNLPMLQQMQPDGFFNGMRPPHHAMMGPAVPPPRPPQGPPPPGPKPPLPHSGAPFFAGAPNFAPLTSIPMESRPQSGNPPLEVQGARPRQKPPGWSLSHGMEGLDRTGNGQEPMLAADMVWDAEGQGNARSVFTCASSHNASWRLATQGMAYAICVTMSLRHEVELEWSCLFSFLKDTAPFCSFHEPCTCARLHLKI